MGQDANSKNLRAEMIAYYEREQERSVDEALRGIARARKELDEIEEQLNLAVAGSPYRRIGEVRGADAGAIFSAFGTIESKALMSRFDPDLDPEDTLAEMAVEEELEVGECEVCGEAVPEGLRYMAGPLAGRMFCEDHDPMRGGPRADFSVKS